MPSFYARGTGARWSSAAAVGCQARSLRGARASGSRPRAWRPRPLTTRPLHPARHLLGTPRHLVQPLRPSAAAGDTARQGDACGTRAAPCAGSGVGTRVAEATAAQGACAVSPPRSAPRAPGPLDFGVRGCVTMRSLRGQAARAAGTADTPRFLDPKATQTKTIPRNTPEIHTRAQKILENNRDIKTQHGTLTATRTWTCVVGKGGGLRGLCV